MGLKLNFLFFLQGMSSDEYYKLPYIDPLKVLKQPWWINLRKFKLQCLHHLSGADKEKKNQVIKSFLIFWIFCKHENLLFLF